MATAYELLSDDQRAAFNVMWRARLRELAQLTKLLAHYDRPLTAFERQSVERSIRDLQDAIKPQISEAA